MEQNNTNDSLNWREWIQETCHQGQIYNLHWQINFYSFIYSRVFMKYLTNSWYGSRWSNGQDKVFCLMILYGASQWEKHKVNKSIIILGNKYSEEKCSRIRFADGWMLRTTWEEESVLNKIIIPQRYPRLKPQNSWRRYVTLKRGIKFGRGIKGATHWAVK